MLIFDRPAVVCEALCRHGADDPEAGPHQAVLRIRIRIRSHRIHMFLGLPDPDPLVRGMDQDPDPDPDPDPSFYHHGKIVRKTLIPTIL
jgi:hypothetical protein